MNIQSSRQCVLETSHHSCHFEGREYGSEIKLKIVKTKCIVHEGSISYILVCDRY